MKKKGLIFLILAVISVSFLFGGCGKKEDSKQVSTNNSEEVLRLGVNKDGRPYVFVENNELTGFEGDMWKEISKRTGIKLEYQYNNVQGLFGLLDSGKIDVVAHYIGRTPQRQEKYDFSDCYAKATLQVVLKKEAKDIKSVEDLYGKNLAVGAGSASAGVIQKLDPDKKIKIKTYEDTHTPIQDVAMGRVDGYLGNAVSLNNDIDRMNVDCKLSDYIVHSTDVAYPYRKGDEKTKKIIDKVNKAVKDMVDEGVVTDISKKWFGKDFAKSEKK